ncbi:MAG: hypothetical protein SF053_21100 [Bacteroidia bacterium]|nr:hypothetical protein [Bacteroidia bacterium]
MKNTIGLSLLAIGLFLTIRGYSVSGAPEKTIKAQGTEVVVRNSNNYNLNWRTFFGLTNVLLGIGLLAFPSNYKIQAAWEVLPDEADGHEVEAHH